MKKIYLMLTTALLAGILGGTQTAQAQLSGTYTINLATATGGTNYQTFNAAATALTTQGISAPVVFNVATGSYNEQIIIPQITGTSATNTITINGNGATLTYNPTVTTERAVLKLNGADHFIFDSLTVSATGTTATEYGYGIQLLNGADSNIIRKCTVNTSLTTTLNIAGNYAGILINSVADAVLTRGNSGCDYNIVTGNTINGGLYSIALVADSAASMIYGNQITNNKVYDFYNVGIYMNGNNGTLVEGNDISRPTRMPLATSPVYQFLGIKLEKSNTNLRVSKNKIHNPFGANTTGSSGTIAIYLIGCMATAGNENIFSNNLIYDVQSSGLATGIDISDNGANVSNYNKFIHNTISFEDPNSAGYGATRGFTNTLALTGFTFVNNIISISRGGPGAKHCIYLSNTGNTSTVINNNDFSMRSTTGLTIAVGSYGGTRATLADWQTASGYDLASLSIDPLFVSSTNVVPTATALASAGQATTITTDINNVLRSTTAPTIGAYEAQAACATPTALAVSGITATGATATWASAGGNHQVQFGLNGFALGAGTFTTNLTANTYSFSGLAPLTTYQYYVRDSCSATSLSGWAGPFNFTTPCAIPATPVAPNVALCGAGAVTLTATSATANVAYNWYPSATGGSSLASTATYNTPSLTASATYYVSAVSVTCESARTPVTAIIHSLPVVRLGNDTTICTGISLTLNAGNSGSRYQWSNNDTTAATSITTGGTYVVTVTDTNTCFNRDTIVIALAPKATVAGITITPSPTTPRTVSCAASGIQNVVSYSWSFGDGATSTAIAPAHTYAQNGTYTVTLKVQNACGDSTITQLVTISATGIAQTGIQDAIRLYPNPVNDVLTISLDQAPQSGAHLQIADATGRIVATQQMKGTSATIATGGFASGIYFVHLISGGNTAKAKFIKL